MHDRCAPTTKVFTRQMELRHIGMPLQNRVDHLSQLSDSFAVDDAHAQDATCFALDQIIQHKVLHLARPEGMQIQHAINRQLDRLIVHNEIEPRMDTNEHGFRVALALAIDCAMLRQDENSESPTRGHCGHRPVQS